MLHNGGPNNVIGSIVEINKIESQKADSKIKTIHSYNSVTFNDTSMVFWQHFQCGKGKKVTTVT